MSYPLRATSRLRLQPLVLGVFLSLTIAAATACGGTTSSPAPTATPTQIPTPQPTATAAPTATPTAPTAPAEPSGERALAHVEALSVEIGPRPAGTDKEASAAEYAASHFRSYGYSVELQPFPFSATFNVPASLSVDAPQPITLRAMALRGSASGVLSAELVDGGLGRAEDFPPDGLNGAVALVRRGQVSFAEMVERAVAAGASALVIVNDEPGILYASLDSPASIPVVGVSREDGESLLDLLTEGEITVTLKAPPEAGASQNVVARPPSGQCETVSGAHYDSVQAAPGANDNASGAAVVLELARAVAAAELPGEHCFVLFGAEEIGLLGSGFFVEQLSQEESAYIRAMLNFDVVGGGPEGLRYIGNPTLIERVNRLASRAGIVASEAQPLQGYLSDHASFENAGIVAIWFATPTFDYIHTPSDTLDRIQASSLADAALLGFLLISELGQP